ncbi:hypothetical protein [Stenotrophomonas sp. YIM B06876]|uniref:hypothetical protein n=1 Tax=Stenotrophomonas sp. YIM B06876 TaxID=3060211 RepID=UPI0027384BB5|nr:hypothetical protein [Stenotrophomonas sp. YIM B06876]
MAPTSAAASRTVHWLWPLLLVLGSVTLTIAWLLVALSTGTQAGWMAVVAALEAAWMLRLGTFRPGRARVLVAAAATLLITLAANWSIAAAHIGSTLGLTPWESSLKLGPHLAWTLFGLANGLGELLWLLLGLVVAWRLAR